MKLSFSLPSKQSKPASNPTRTKFATEIEDSSADNRATKPQYVTEFDASQTLINPNHTKNLVIPPKENEWRPHKKMKNIDLPSIRSSNDGEGLQFEVESGAIADPGEKMSYGLNLRNGGGDDLDVGGGSESIDSALLKKLKEDLNRLPEDEGFDQFEEVPVEGFGAALLAGYGWKEGRGIGKNAKEDVKVVEYKRRTGKEGLGFSADIGSKKVDENGVGNKRDKEEKKESSGFSVGKEGLGFSADHDTGGKRMGENGVGNVRDKEEKREISGFSIGKEVRIVSGRDSGLKGRIMEVLSSGDLLVLKLSRSEEEVMVRVKDVAEPGSVEEERCLRKLKEMKIQASKDDVGKDGMKSKDSSSNRSDRERKESKRNREDGSRRGVSVGVGEVKRDSGRSEEGRSWISWLRSHIRVRIISKEFKGGRFYLKKGEVVDVVGPTTCDISMDDGRELVQGVDQDILETALPRRGGPVLVLFGKHKGVYGSLVERDSDRETGVVQDADSHELHNVRLEQIAEYLGDPSYVGY